MNPLQNDFWFVNFIKKPKARLRLFCFPHGGGGASFFRDWPSLLPPDVELYAIQPPGRENRFLETPYTQMQPLVETLAQGIRPLLDIPFAFFGHSLGALVAFELARLLRRNTGIQPLSLFVSGCGAPQIHENTSIHQLPEAEFIETVKKYNGIPDEVAQNQELMQLILPSLYGDFTIFETYRYTTELPLNCNISAYGGKQDHSVSEAKLAAWIEQTTKKFELQMFPGDHFYLTTQAQLLLQKISGEIDLQPASTY